jgi:hypothetical protein
VRRLVPAVLAAAVLVACGGGGGGAGSATGPVTSEPTATRPTPSPSPTPTETTEAPTPTEVTGLPSPLPPPLPSSIEQGGTYFGVYLAAGPQGSPELDAAVAQLAAVGVGAYPGDIACDQGAAEQLGVADNLMAVAMYFETRSDAETFAAALDPPPLGVAKVKTYCAD